MGNILFVKKTPSPKKDNSNKVIPTKKVQGNHIEIFNVKDDPDLDANEKKYYERVVEDMKYWTDPELQRKQIGSIDDYGPLNIDNLIEDVIVYENGERNVDDPWDYLDEDGWFKRIGHNDEFPYDNLNSMMKVLKIVNPRQYIYAAALFEHLAGRGSDRLVVSGEKAIVEWVDKKGKVKEKKRPKYLKKGAKRPSPTPSATSVKENEVAIGNDDNFYVSKKDKNGKQSWKKITDF